MRTLPIAVLLLSAAALVGCSTDSSLNGVNNDNRKLSSEITEQPSTVGTIVGQFRVVGGPISPAGQVANHPLEGTIDIHRGTANGTIVKSVATAKNGRFSVVLPPGSYLLVGRTPQITGPGGGCAELHATVLKPGKTAHAQVVCNVP